MADSIKHAVEQVAVEDSRGAAQLGRTLHWQGLTDEAKHNEQNPGRAMTKATIDAALWYLGAAGGDALGGGAGGAAGAGDESAGLAMDAANTAGTVTADELAKQAALAASDPAVANAATNALSEAPQASSLPPSMPSGSLLQNAAYRAVPGAGPQQAQMLASQTGDFGPQGLGMTMQSAAGAQGLSPAQQALGQYGGGLLGQLGGAGGSKMGSQLMLKMGMDMLSPKQQSMPSAPPPQGGGQQAPLASPYSGAFGPGGNSLGPPQGFMTEEQKKRLRMMGYQV